MRLARSLACVVAAASMRGGVRGMAAPRKKLPTRRVDVSCAECGAKIFKYAKGNGAGSQLVKVYDERIVKDHTGGVKDTCPACNTTFAWTHMLSIRQGLAVWVAFARHKGPSETPRPHHSGHMRGPTGATPQ